MQEWARAASIALGLSSAHAQQAGRLYVVVGTEQTECCDDRGEAPFTWSSTTHLDGPADRRGTAAVYVAFGRALGWMRIPPGAARPRLLDVHGAGAQRSDPKQGDPADFPFGRGPQGDVVRIENHVRCVRAADGP